MNKKIKLLILVVVCGVLLYVCGSQGWLVPDPVREVRRESLEDLRKSVEDITARFEKKTGEGKFESSHDVAAAHEKLGRKYLEQLEWTPAIEAFRTSVEYGYSNASIHHALAVAYANRGKYIASDEDFRKAEAHYKLAIKHTPNNWDSHYGLAILNHFELDRKDEAMSIVQNIIRNEPAHYRARFAYARFLYEGGQPERSLAEYEEIYSMLQRGPDIPEKKEYKQNARTNITRLMTELSRR